MQNSALTTLSSGRFAAARPARLAALTTGVAAAALAALPQVASAGVIAPDSGATSTGDAISTVYIIVGALGLIALLAVIISIISAVRRPAAEGSPVRAATEDTAKLAVTGSLAIVIVLAVLGGLTLSSASNAGESASGTPAAGFKLTPLEDPNLKTGNDVEVPKGPAIGVHVNGQQFLWRYGYLGTSVYSYHDLVIPVGVTAMLYVTSSDVEHNWWVPSLGPPIQAVPGYLNSGWIRADKAGTFNGASTVLSGTNYQDMSTRVIAMPVDKYKVWIKQKGLELKESALGLAAQTAAQSAAQSAAQPAAQGESK